MENIFNRPPSIAQDTLKYTIYPPPSSSDRSATTSYAAVIRSFVDSVLTRFIWHRDPFELKVVKDLDNDGWLIEGLMRVGDSVDDEWCVVWLLREISAKWDIAARFAHIWWHPSSFLMIFV
jgi:SGT1 protein